MSVRDKIKTLSALKGTLHVWEALAVNRYKRYSSVAGAQLPYFLRLQEVLEHLYSLYRGPRRGLLEMREETSVDVLILTSDRGYVGEFLLTVLDAADSLLETLKGKRVNLFIAGRRGVRSRHVKTGAVIFEEVIGRDIDWEMVSKIREVLVERYRRKYSDACYVVFQRPQVTDGRLLEMEERERKEAVLKESPFLFPKFEEVFRAKPLEVVEKGRYRPIVTRFIPPQIKGRYLEETVLNLEVPEEEFIEELLNLYLSFFIKEVFIEHFASLCFARFRTIRRITDNIDRKLKEYRLEENRERKDRINREIRDIVFSQMASEERKFRECPEAGYVLEVDHKLGDDELSSLVNALEGLGFNIKEVRRGNLIGGFRLVGTSEAWELSVYGLLRALRGGTLRRPPFR